MSNSLVLSNSRAVGYLNTQVLAQHLESMDEAVQLTSFAIDELRRLNCYTANKAVDTLRLAKQKLQVAQARGQLSAEKQKEFENLTHAYLADVMRIAEEAGADIANIVGRSRASTGFLLSSGR